MNLWLVVAPSVPLTSIGGLRCLRENYALPVKSRRDGLRVAQDVVLGNDKQAGQSREGRLNTGAEFQSSLRDCSMAHS